MQRQTSPASSTVRGFTLVEVLIAVFVIGIGLLGMARMQILSIRDTSNAYLRSRAVLLADEIVERMRVNRPAALSGQYNVDFNSDTNLPAASDCTAAACNDAAIANADLYIWLAKIRTLLPEGEASISCTNGQNCTIILEWTEREQRGRTSQTEQLSLSTRL